MEENASSIDLPLEIINLQLITLGSYSYYLHYLDINIYNKIRTIIMHK